MTEIVLPHDSLCLPVCLSLSLCLSPAVLHGVSGVLHASDRPQKQHHLPSTNVKIIRLVDSLADSPGIVTV